MNLTGNLISVTFTEEELTKLDEAIKVIETIIADKSSRLSAEERKQFGRIAEQNKLFVNKTKMYMEEYPQYIPPFLDKAEFDRDYQAREIIEKRLMRLERVTDSLSSTKILLDNDNYTNALTFYRNIKFLSKENMPGTEAMADTLSQFFSRTKKKAADEENNLPDAEKKSEQ